MLRVVHDASTVEVPLEKMPLDELARVGARKMLRQALEAEVASYVERHQEERDADGRAVVVRNGTARARQVTVGSGTIEVEAPRVNDKRVDERGQRQRFTSKILLPYMRRSPKVAEVLPVLYLRGLSTGDFREALPVLLGKDAAGLSPTSITRFTACWEDEYRAFHERDLSDRDYVYVWADGIHFNIRLEDDRLCTLVLLGARADGTKEVITGSTTILDETHTRCSFVATIDAAGTVTLPANIFTDDDDDDPECPTTATVATLTFSGNMAVLHITETATCGTTELSATMTRQ